MKKMLLCQAAIAIIVILAAQSHAESTLSVGANVRLRYEFQDDFNQQYYGDNPRRGSQDDGFLLGRFQAGIEYWPVENIHFSLWMQDSEAWDNALSDSAFYNDTFGMENNPNKDRWELGDAYVEINKIAGLPLSCKGGRQKIAYGDKRVFGPGEWGNTGRWVWDATRLSYKCSRGFVDVYYGRTVLHDSDRFSLIHRHGFESVGVYGSYELPGYLFHSIVEPFFMTKADGHDRYKSETGRKGDLKTYYGGLRSFRSDWRGFDYDFTIVGQGGDYSDDEVKAYGYHLLLGYMAKRLQCKPRLSIEYSFASGDSDPYDGDHETFDGGFGAKDLMYGRMNLFSWENLKDAQINLEASPRDRLSLKAEFHTFWLADKKDAWYLNKREYRDRTGKSGDEVGKEFDIVATCRLSENNEVQCGFGHFWPDEFAKSQASRTQANWVFFQWQYKISEKLLPTRGSK